MIVYLRMTWRKFVNSSNKRCTIVYERSFSCKVSCAEVKQAAMKLHKSPHETDRAWSRSLHQMRESDSGLKPGLGRLQTLEWLLNRRFVLKSLLGFGMTCICVQWHITGNDLFFIQGMQTFLFLLHLLFFFECLSHIYARFWTGILELDPLHALFLLRTTASSGCSV